MLTEFGKDTKETIEATVGKGRTAFMVWVVWAAVISAGLLVILTLGYQIKEKVVDPYIIPFTQEIPSLSVENASQILLSLSITVFLLVFSGFILVRWFKRWEKTLILSIENYVRGNTTSLRAVDITELRKDVDELMRQASGLNLDLIDYRIRDAIRRRLIIHSALYGANGKTANVTDQIRGFIKNNEINIPVENETFGGADPNYGVHKELQVAYSIGDGAVEHTTVSEHGRLILPPSQGGRISALLRELKK